VQTLVLAVVILAISETGCGGSEPVSKSIAAAVDAGVGTRVALADYQATDWNKVCIFGPYTPDSQVDAITGIQGAAMRAYDIRLNEGIDVLMFISKDRIVTSITHRRSRGDFGPEIVGKCYSREQAVFLVRNPPSNSWGTIGPP
jgi:hypothetical protein